jgi:hypothetical protein
MKKMIGIGFGILSLWVSSAHAVIQATVEQPGPLLSGVQATATSVVAAGNQVTAGVAASATKIEVAVAAAATKIEDAVADSATKIESGVAASATKIEVAIAASATKIEAAVEASGTRVETAVAASATTINAGVAASSTAITKSVDASATRIETSVAASATKIEAAVGASGTRVETAVAASATRVENAVAVSTTTLNAAIIGNNKPGGTVYLFGFDGTNFFPLRADTTNGLDVDVTRVQGSLTIAHTLTITGQAGVLLDVGGIGRTQTGKQIAGGLGNAAHVLPVGVRGSASHYNVTLGAATITALLPMALDGASHITIFNDSGQTIFLGGSDVTVGGAAPAGDHKGISVTAGSSYTLDNINGDFTIFAVKTTAGSCQVLRW